MGIRTIKWPHTWSFQAYWNDNICYYYERQITYYTWSQSQLRFCRHIYISLCSYVPQNLTTTPQAKNSNSKEKLLNPKEERNFHALTMKAQSTRYWLTTRNGGSSTSLVGIMKLKPPRRHTLHHSRDGGSKYHYAKFEHCNTSSSFVLYLWATKSRSSKQRMISWLQRGGGNRPTQNCTCNDFCIHNSSSAEVQNQK